MRIDLVDGFYTTRSLSAAAQRCYNLFPEAIEASGGSGKNTKILRGSPGYHLLANLNTHTGNVRGFWGGGGRVFVVVGSWLYEINNSGTVLASGNMTLDDNTPVQMFGNGNQLGIVNAGQFFLATGAGAGVITILQTRFQISGTVTAVGANLTWQSGDKFTAGMVGAVINVSGHLLIVISYTDPTHITVSGPLGGGAGTGYLQNVGSFTWASGDLFTSALEGLPITINGVSYTVDKVVSDQVLTLINPDRNVFPQGGPWVFNAVQPNLTYACGGGDLVTALTGAYLDGQFYVQRPSGGSPDLGRQVNFSAVNDGTSWSGLDFFIKEASPDYINAIFADREQLYVFGTEASEVYQNDASTGRPVRITGAAAREGLAARYSVVSMNQRIYFLGGSEAGGAVAYRLDGFTPTRISTHAIEEQWAEFGANIQNSVSWWYLEEGHYFWVICLSNDHAWVYDATEKLWTERGAGAVDLLLPYPIWYHTYIPEWTQGGLRGLHIVGNYANAKVYVMSAAFSDEEGGDVNRVRDLPYLYNEDKRVFTDRFQLSMDTGETNTTEQFIGLQISDDNGATISSIMLASFGTAGQFGKRVYWVALGSADTSRLFRVTYTGQQAITLIDANAEVAWGTT